MGIFKGKHAKMLTLMVSISLVVVLTYIAIVDDKESRAKSDGVIKNYSELEALLAKDLDKDYPITAREVMKYYCQVQQCMFNNELSDSTLENVLDKEFQLYDKDFIKKNTFGQLLKNREAEIKKFKEEKKTIFGYELDPDDNEKEWTNEGRQCSAIQVNMKMSGDDKKVVKEVFILRKDANDQWKIVGNMSAEDYTKSKKEIADKKIKDKVKKNKFIDIGKN